MDAKKTEINIVDNLGNQVSGTLSIPDDARSVLVMSHGFSSNRNSGLYKDFGQEFNDIGIGTARYEYYGHGPAYGQPGPGYGMTEDVTLSKAVESLRSVVGHIRDIDDFNIGLLGSSFGGLLSIIIASEDQKIKALGTKSSVTQPIRFWYGRAEDKLGEHPIETWEKDGKFHYKEGVEDYTLPWEFWVDLQEYGVLGDAKNIKCPTKIVHGDEDTCVPIFHSNDLAKVVGTEVKVINGAGHAYSGPGQYQEMKKLFFNFFAKYL
jgi:dipeptidyl aminopeptidase/acylaminoacyl peptidase